MLNVEHFEVAKAYSHLQAMVKVFTRSRCPFFEAAWNKGILIGIPTVFDFLSQNFGLSTIVFQDFFTNLQFRMDSYSMYPNTLSKVNIFHALEFLKFFTEKKKSLHWIIDLLWQALLSNKVYWVKQILSTEDVIVVINLI